jgi:hypothetical protein
MPARTNNFNVETLKGQSLVKKVRETTDQIADQVRSRIFESVRRQATFSIPFIVGCQLIVGENRLRVVICRMSAS